MESITAVTAILIGNEPVNAIVKMLNEQKRLSMNVAHSLDQYATLVAGSTIVYKKQAYTLAYKWLYRTRHAILFLRPIGEGRYAGVEITNCSDTDTFDTVFRENSKEFDDSDFYRD